MFGGDLPLQLVKRACHSQLDWLSGATNYSNLNAILCSVTPERVLLWVGGDRQVQYQPRSWVNTYQIMYLKQIFKLTEFDQSVPLLPVFHVGKIHLPAFQAFLFSTVFIPTLELTWKIKVHTALCKSLRAQFFFPLLIRRFFISICTKRDIKINWVRGQQGKNLK